MKALDTRNLVVCALLIALSVAIPMFMPPVYNDGIVSATPASHLPVILAMFISPTAAIVTSVGSALGFFMRGAPLVICVRAFSHVLFTFAGALFIASFKGAPIPPLKLGLLLLVTAILHALGEVMVVIVFKQLFLVKGSPLLDQGIGYVVNVLGVVTLAHHLFDFTIAAAVLKGLRVANAS